MAAVKKETTAKIGLVGCISVLFGSIIGVGIFFKNQSVFQNNDYNAIGILLSWIIAAVISFALAVSFAEIASGKTRIQNAGLVGAADAFCGQKFGKAMRVWQPFVYNSIYTFAIGVFLSETLFNSFSALWNDPGQIKPHMGYVLLGAVVITAAFLAFNYISFKWATKYGQALSLVKFIPIILVAGIGIVGGAMSGGGYFNPADAGNVHESGDINVLGIFESIPAILFAFDSFWVVILIRSKVNKPETTIPKSIMLTMMIVTIVYMLVTIGLICLGGSGNPYDIGLITDNQAVATTLSTIMSVLLLVALSGTLNSFCMTSVASFEVCMQNDFLAGSKFLKSKTGHNAKKAGLIYASIIMSFYFLAFGIPSIILNSDQIIDGASTVAVVVFFGFYATMVLGALINRKTNKVEVQKSKVFIPAAIIAIVGCYYVLGFASLYTYLIDPILDPAKASSWGLFRAKEAYGAKMLTTVDAAIVFYVIIVWIAAIPFINSFLQKNFKNF